MKEPKIRYYLYSDGSIDREVRLPWYKRLFKEKWKQYETTNKWVLKKEYTETELKKLWKFQKHNPFFTEEDIMVIVNAIRPNTFKESFDEINSGKYYIDAKTKNYIHLLAASK